MSEEKFEESNAQTEQSYSDPGVQPDYGYQQNVNEQGDQPNYSYQQNVNNAGNQPNYGYQQNFDYTNAGSQASYGSQPNYQNQANYQYNGTTPEGNNGSWQQQYINPKPAEPTKAFGIAAMILGIISLVLFCTCINIPLAIAAIVLAIVQLVKGGKKGMAVAGLVTGAASIVCFVIFWVLISIGVIDESLTYSYDIPYYEWEEEFEDNFYDTFDL